MVLSLAGHVNDIHHAGVGLYTIRDGFRESAKEQRDDEVANKQSRARCGGRLRVEDAARRNNQFNGLY